MTQTFCTAAFIAALLASAATAPTAFGVDRPDAAPQSSTGNLTEFLLPDFQNAVFEADGPVTQILLQGNDILWSLGQRSLWRWDLAGKKLRKYQLAQGSRVSADQQSGNIAFDGQNIFVQSSTSLHQLNLESSRIFRYPLPRPDGPLAMGGYSDNFWILAGQSLLKFDRYGKTLIPKTRFNQIGPGQIAAISAGPNNFWRVDGNQVYLSRLDAAGANTEKLVLKTRNPIRDIQTYGNGVILHTARTVLRLDASGKKKQQVPVEGKRRLTAMHISDGGHYFLFDDQLLERFEPDSRTVMTWRLPVDDNEQPGRIMASGPVVAVITGGRVRAFRTIPALATQTTPNGKSRKIRR